MARVNISLPDEIYRRAKEAGLNVSQLARRAITQELSDRAKIAGAYAYLAEMEREHGPLTADEIADARAWADDVYGTQQRRASA
ncbi:MAG TPA: type II toxin-antitoxin system CcdA family antitoxin [Jiangellaceae bacterium]